MINITFKTELDELSSLEKRLDRFMKRYKVGLKHRNRKDRFLSPGKFINDTHNTPAVNFLQSRYPHYRDDMLPDPGGYTTSEYNRIKINTHIIYLMQYCAVDELDLFVYYTL